MNKFTPYLIELLSDGDRPEKLKKLNCALYLSGYTISKEILEIIRPVLRYDLLHTEEQRRIKGARAFNIRDTYLCFLACMTIKELLETGLFIKEKK